MLRYKHKQPGFTIVELLIVIVVIGILAAITIVAYNGVQQRARDTARQSGISNLTKALEIYYSINAQYPTSSGSTVINSGWSTTADASWQNLINQLVPTYVSVLPRDPGTSTATAAISGGSNYDYYAFSNTTYCGSSAGQGYLLTYHLENSSQVNTLVGNCTGTPVGPYGPASNYRVVK